MAKKTDPYQHHTTPDGKQLKFDIKAKRFLLMICEFDCRVFLPFWENQLSFATGINRLDAVGYYEENLTYVIYFLDAVYPRETLYNEITETLNSYFK